MQQRQTLVTIWAERVMEACWLLALVMAPVYFSLLTARHFEPDKAIVLRALMLVLVAAWAIKLLERGQSLGEWPRWREWRSAPLLIPIALYVVVFLLTSLSSLHPWMSFFGGYNRLQGFYTNFSYIILALALVANLQRREQLERLITVVILAALPVAGYGIMQHRGIDPLPWKGDVITRVASTMGNSIFVAAYLILVVPLALYRLVAAGQKLIDPEEIDRETPGWLDLAWGAAMALLVVGQLALLNGVLKLGALLYVLDLSAWWLYPLAVIVVASSYPLFTNRLMQQPRSSIWPYLPGVLLVIFALMMLSAGMLTAEACGGNNPGRTLCLQMPKSSGDSRNNAVDFGRWLLIGYSSIFLFYVLLAALPRRASQQASRLLSGLTTLGMAIAVGVLLITILFTQSRGPMLGLFATLILFGTLILIQGRRTTTRARRAKLLNILLALWVAISLAGASFLLVLNTVPGSFQSLRDNRYIARLGALTEVSSGTGKVRMLIWRGDGVTRGSIDLILAQPLRTLIGWGPETMFVAYNPYYPPDLGHYESRGASPDRAHQALLDELAHKGVLGFFTHILLFGGFMMLMLRFLRVPRWLNLLLITILVAGIALFFAGFLGSPILGLLALATGALAVAISSYLGYDRPVAEPLPFLWQTFFIACLALMVGNFVETFFGIPIVSSLTYTWMTLGIGIVGGMMAGVYPLGRQRAGEQAAAAEAGEQGLEVAGADKAQGPGKKKARRQAQRGGEARGRQGRAVAAQRQAPIRWVYPLIMLAALLSVWHWNLDVTYADMRFNQGQQWADGQSLDRELLAFAAYSDAIESVPHEDFYYLYYGRTLLALAQIVGQQQVELVREGKLQQEVMSRQPTDADTLADLPDPNYAELLNNQSAYNEVANWFLQHGSFEVLNYARLAMERAQQLSPLNKDHYANLGRIYATWYRSTQQKQKLDQAIKYYEKAHKVAPQDVTLMGQWASLVANKDAQKAEQILRKALELDQSGDPVWNRVYPENYARLGEVLRQQGDLQGAAEMYARAVSINPNVFSRLVDVDPTRQLEPKIRQALAQDRSALRAFAEGYATYIERRPEDLRVRLHYTRLLSDSHDFRGALQEAQKGLQVAEESLRQAADHRRQAVHKQLQAFKKLMEYLQNHAPIGE